MPDYFDLGSHSRSITTSSPEAQRWFDRGLIWTYGFNHEEAVRCFRRALDADPRCAMAQWGIAYAAGPNYNYDWDHIDLETLVKMLATTGAAVEQASALAPPTSPVERALIEAIAARYQSTTVPDDLWVWSDAYADAMRAVYAAFPDDLDVVALFAEALINRTPWRLWDLPTGEPAHNSSAVEARQVLERAMTTPDGMRHPGVLHMYIHLMEMSPFPEKAAAAADALRGLVPDAGHLHHMPTHIDMLCGDYQAVVDSNSAAIVADEKYREREGAMNVYTLYRTHNYHFKLYGAMFLGQSDVAIEAAEGMVNAIPIELMHVQTPPMADRLEARFSMKLHALIRFGRWQEIIDTPLPDDPTLYCVSTAMVHYARGVAFAATGVVAEAEEQRRLFEAAYARVPETRVFQNNTCRDILGISAEMLAGELEYRKGNYDLAFDHLRRSVERSDGLLYSEPWAWMQPPRHALGALLLEQGQVDEAADVYRADLGLDDSLPRAHQHPDNVWALHGYHECLVRQGKLDEAAAILERLDAARGLADVPVESSCFCRSVSAA
ncbi:MAG: tetratricopeptide repeat protein [Thermomicrobiales bacterium]|nr:tetratricopeptide repeat protein [Thermomicrobiales bacterium]